MIKERFASTSFVLVEEGEKGKKVAEISAFKFEGLEKDKEVKRNKEPEKKLMTPRKEERSRVDGRMIISSGPSR